MSLFKPLDNKKRFSAYALISTLLFLALAGSYLVDLTTANPVGVMLPHDPHATIYLQTPISQKPYNETDITVSFSVDLSAWVPPWPDWNPSYSFSSTVVCKLDGAIRFWQGTVNDSPKVHFFRVPLLNLSEGSHNVTVEVTTEGEYFHRVVESDGPHFYIYDTTVDSSEVVSFRVALVPLMILVLSPEFQQILSGNDISLTFNLSKPASWMGYSLDGQRNATVPGNTTLTGLSEGTHSVVVFARDSSGQERRSNIRFFDVAEAPESFQTSSLMPGIEVAIVASAAIVSFGLAAHFVRRNRRRSK